MTDASSCLINAFSYYIDITDEERVFLTELERDEVALGRNQHVYRRDQDLTCLYVVKRGWLFSYVDLDDGRRQIVKIHHPGDVIGFPDLATPKATSNLQSAAEAVICPFPRKLIRRSFARCPNVAALLFTLSMRDQIIMYDTIRLLGRMAARERLAFMLLDLLARLRIAKGDMSVLRIRLPMTQTEIGDYLGLTNVHVSRAFRMLEEAALIERMGQDIRLCEEEALARLAHFENRYHEIDTDWMLETAHDP